MERLPEEMLAYLFEFLSFPSLAAIKCTCHRMEDAIDSDEVLSEELAHVIESVHRLRI